MDDPIRLAILKDKIAQGEDDPTRHPLLRTPAEQRIRDEADWLFRERGIRNVTIEHIARRSGTNAPFVLEYFGSLEDLVVEYLKRRVAEQRRADERFWLRVQKEYPKDQKQQLRAWICAMAPGSRDPFIPIPLTMQAIDFLYDMQHPGRAIVVQYKADLRDYLARLCCDAFFRQPEVLAEKLLMLAEGAFVQRTIFGGEQPAERLIEAAEDLFKRHWESA